MFNEYVWQNYLNAGGKDVVKMFEENLTVELSENYADFVAALRKAYCPSKFVVDYTHSNLIDLYNDLNEGLYLLADKEKYTMLDALDEFYNHMKGEENLSSQKIFDWFSGSVEYFTTLLSIELPNFFVPYYFTYNFNVYEKIAQEFGIETFPVPSKREYEDRFYYYGALCTALLDFRKAHNMSPYELCAFLYDFAPKYIGGINSYILKELPEPKGAFFVGGTKKDIFLSDNTETVTPWQCNPDTRAGDMIAMYLKTPVSAVTSIWRSVSVGFNDPFFYYYRCTYIANPVKINPVSKNQIETDSILKEMPIVRKNLQGINGIELRPSQYNHLLDLAQSDALRLEFDITADDPDLVNEKDVENKLIKPLLAKLGYTSADYTQQLQIEIGNHNATMIPDFVLLPVTVNRRSSAFAILEAKYRIPNQKELEDVLIQARSYAVQLKAPYCVIASKDKLWVSSADDDYTADIFTATWAELKTDTDKFSLLFKLIGKKVR